MRWILALALIGGCASTTYAVEQAEWCEQNYPGRCQAYWANVEQERAERQARRDAQDSRHTRRRIGAALVGLGNAYTAAGTPSPPPPPTYRCTTDYIGGQVCTPQ